MEKYKVNLVSRNGEIEKTFSILSRSLRYAKQMAWFKWDFSDIEGKYINIICENGNVYFRKIGKIGWLRK